MNSQTTYITNSKYDIDEFTDELMLHASKNNINEFNDVLMLHQQE